MAEFAPLLTDQKFFFSVRQACRSRKLSNPCIRSTVAFTHGELGEPLDFPELTRREDEYELAFNVSNVANQALSFRSEHVRDINEGLLREIRQPLWWVATVEDVVETDQLTELDVGHFMGVRRYSADRIQIVDTAERDLSRQLMLTDLSDLVQRINKYHLAYNKKVYFYLFSDF